VHILCYGYFVWFAVVLVLSLLPLFCATVASGLFW
jgi:heme exporter protein D